MLNLKPVLYFRYLLSVRALLDDTEYGEMIELSHEFETSIAPRLQRYLNLKWFWSDNYVSDWWEEFVYLRGRSPIMINSNYYVMDALYTHPTRNQVLRFPDFKLSQ
jgi:carnitine O-palmitoyltransferase 1